MNILLFYVFFYNDFTFSTNPAPREQMALSFEGGNCGLKLTVPAFSTARGSVTSTCQIKKGKKRNSIDKKKAIPVLIEKPRIELHNLFLN